MQPSSPQKIRVSIPDQILELTDALGMLVRYPVSTSAFGAGVEPGSHRTPTGRFVVAEKIGHRAPAGMIFNSRLPTGQLAGADDPGDLVLSRILWLDGLEPGNANTRSRYIYIHGTNHEDDIGRPASHGCVRMRNADILELYEKVGEGTPVEIVE